MLKVISLVALVAQLFPLASPGVDRLDATARAGGNLKPVAVKIGRTLFATRWPAQVLNVYADGVRGHDIAGLRVSGVHFHKRLDRQAFISEVSALAQKTFSAAPIDEVDIWASVPLRVGKDIVVAGDLARPTARTVFTISIVRGESAASVLRRLRRGDGVYWDQEWTRAALK